MQEVFFRFHHLSETIFDSLDNKSLANCKKVSKSWYFYLDNQKFLQPRIIKANIKKVEEAVEIVKNIYGYFQPWNPGHPTLGVAFLLDGKKDAPRKMPYWKFSLDGMTKNIYTMTVVFTIKL